MVQDHLLVEDIEPMGTALQEDTGLGDTAGSVVVVEEVVVLADTVHQVDLAEAALVGAFAEEVLAG